jgi:hypothetical protein
MARSLLRSYSHYITDPKTYNTVPGQFSEWFDGESLTNRGMRLSPWEPPRYLWAALEGVVGLQPHGDEVKLDPNIPPGWLWLSARRILYHEREFSFFASRHADGLHINSLGGFVSDKGHIEEYDSDLTDMIEPAGAGITASAFARGSEILICLGSLLSVKEPAAFHAEKLFDNARKYKAHAYLSETGDWSDLGTHYGSTLGRLSIEIESQGFVLICMQPA